MSEKETVFGSPVIAKFFGKEEFPVEWEGDEKDLHWFYDDLHCANPISPMYDSLSPWWGKSCEYMYRRFWAPFGKEWLGKIVNDYVYTAIKPRKPEELETTGNYYSKVMPVYARNFLKWWSERLLPEIKTNYNYLDNYDYENASLDELMILLEDYIDIYDRHFNLHWILNLAQFQSTIEFRIAYQEALEDVDEEEIGRILVSVDDKNWDSIKGLVDLRDYVKGNPKLKDIFEREEEPKYIYENLRKSPDAKEFMAKFDEYIKEFGYKTIYAHEYIYELWLENPVPAIELIKTYMETDYDVDSEIAKTKKTMEDSIQEMLSKVKDDEKRKKLQEATDLALPMQPLTPNHHFWLDQACHARGRILLLAIGDKMIVEGLVDERDDVMFLTYDQLRTLYANPKAIDGKGIIAKKRKDLEEAEKLVPPNWLGTVTKWSNYEEPYKGLWGFPQKVDRDPVEADAKEFSGIPASPGTIEGRAVLVKSPTQFDKVKPGDIMVCRMTSPAWIAVFPKLKGLVTDAGGMLAHPAIISREFGIPAVVGTGVATRIVRTGQQIRVNGSKGFVEIIG